MRKKNGFTLVELLSTIVVLGIIFSIAIFLVIKNINNAKENMDLITYNNIKSAAKIYTDDTGAYWYTKDNYEYSCVSLGDLIELGYFDEKVIDRNDKISKNSQLKIIRDKDSKVIKETSFSFEKSILPDVNCNYQSNVSISTNYKGNKVKNVDAKIVYSTSNTDYYRYIYLSEFGEDTITTNDVVYSCKEIGNCSNEPVSNLKSGQLYLAKNDVVRLNVKSNGKILAYINYDNENIAESSKIINATFDNTPPIITLKVYKISSYEGNTPKTKGELLTTISGNYSESTWKNYGYWFDISTNEYSTIKWTYNNAGSTNSGNPSNSGANCNTSCSKTLSGDGSRIAIIEAIDEAGNSSKVEINVYIDRTAPTINVIEQRCSNKDNCLGNLIGNKIEKSTNTNVSIEDKNWSYNSFNIKYNASDSMSAVKEIRILQNVSGVYNKLNTTMTSNNIVNNNSNITISEPGQRYVQVIAYDSAGNSSVANIIAYISNIITIEYNSNGGEGAPTAQNKVYSKDIILSSTKPTRTGYTYASWNTKSDGSGTSYQPGSKYTSNESATLYAQWNINTYNITYNLNGGTKGTNAPTSGTYGSTITVSNPSKTGYTFAGWTVSGTGASLTGTNLKIGTGNITLTANWNINYYYLDLNGLLDGSSSGNITGFGTADVYINGKLVCNDCTDYYDKHPYGSSYSISNIKTATGHTYNGIYSGSASGTIGTSNVYVQLSFSTNTYTITYELNGGTKGANAPTSGKYGSTVTVSNPSRNNYTFTGWTVSGTGSSLSGTSLTIGAGNITLTANWKMKRSIPDFSYTGSYEIVNDSNTKIDNINTYIGNWKIRFLSSGTLKFNDLYNASNGIDIFIVGGGGSGAPGSDYIAQGNHGGSGGGGGAALTIKKLPVSTGISYSIIVGDIVGEATANSSFGTSREAYFTALAGSTPIKPYYISNQEGWAIPIGSGGTGRLSGQTNNYGAQNVISKVGGAGNGADGNYEFNETGNIRYGAGGGNGGSGVSTGQGGYGTLGITGGPDGGGTGGQGCSYAQITASRKYYIVDAKDGNAGTENTGSGGGGGGGRCGSSSTSHGERGLGGNGASGIVIIRNAR